MEVSISVDHPVLLVIIIAFFLISDEFDFGELRKITTRPSGRVLERRDALQRGCLARQVVPQDRRLVLLMVAARLIIVSSSSFLVVLVRHLFLTISR